MGQLLAGAPLPEVVSCRPRGASPMKQKYPWRRFWYEEARAIPIDEHNGYFLDL